MIFEGTARIINATLQFTDFKSGFMGQTLLKKIKLRLSVGGYIMYPGPFYIDMIKKRPKNLSNNQ